MIAARILALATVGALALGDRPRCQDWTDGQLIEAIPGFLEDELPPRLTQIAELLKHETQAYSAICARIHGDHREYLLKIDRLLDELADERWAVREEAERTLIEIGARARALIQQRVEEYTTLEESIRSNRILKRIDDRGTEQEEREIRLLRGLVATALYMRPELRLLRALRSALGHTDPIVVEGAIRALGRHGGDEEVSAIGAMLEWKGGVYQRAALGALPRMKGSQALAACAELLAGDGLSRSQAIGLVHNLRLRDDAGDLMQSLRSHPDSLVAAAAALELPESTEAPAPVALTLADRTPLEASFLDFTGDGIRVGDPVEGLAAAEIPFAECDIFDFPGNDAKPTSRCRVFLNQGSLLTGELVGLDEKQLRLNSPVFGELQIDRTGIQGVALDPKLDRLVGASTEHDRVRLKTNKFVDGRILRLDGPFFLVEAAGGAQQVPVDEVSGLMLTRPRVVEPDTAIYARMDLTNGDRILGYLAGMSQGYAGVVMPMAGSAVVPIADVRHVELGVGGGALWGFTLIADYSDNRIVEVDDQGREVPVLDEVYGAWDVECLDNGNLLITEFSVSRVQEVTRAGDPVWVFEDLKNPYDADRLPNGNTLIADTFASRVIEVNPQGEIVWQFAKEIRPFDTDRLANGNTLIADVLKDRVLEVDKNGEIVWQIKNMPNAHDADRLPNGNTLITLRTVNKVIEVDRDGKVVFEITDLNSPSDADRLPDGHTLVAENGMVREFDRRGHVVWQKEMTWAVEVNRY